MEAVPRTLKTVSYFLAVDKLLGGLQEILINLNKILEGLQEILINSKKLLGEVRDFDKS